MNLIAAPPSVNTATMNPASHFAKSCRVRGAAEEKTICPTFRRISRLPKPDQIKIGQSLVSGKTKANLFGYIHFSFPYNC